MTDDESDNAETEILHWGELEINNTSTNLKSGSINSQLESFFNYKHEIILSTAEVIYETETPILQDSIYKVIAFEVLTNLPNLESGDYVVQLNENVLNTLNDVYHTNSYEIGSDDKEIITIDSGTLRINKSNNSNYELDFVGMDSLNNFVKAYYNSYLIEGFDF